MPTIKFGWYEFVISHRVDTYRNLLEVVDRQFEKDLSELTQEVEKAVSELEDDFGRSEYPEYLIEEYLEREEYKGIFLNSFFASSFALFEHELVQVCEWARMATKNPFSVKDFGGRDHMGNVKRYLKKVGVVFPADTLEWKQATEYRTIRNKVMHEGGMLGENDGIISFANENGIVVETSLMDGDTELRLQLTRSFCEKALNDYRKILVQVSSAYRQWLQERTP